jgi:hypothetical protein
MKLPTNFKLKETTTPKAAKKKKTKKKTTQVHPKAKAQGALARVLRVSVVPPKKKSRAARPKAKAPIQPKKKMKTLLKSPEVPSLNAAAIDNLESGLKRKRLAPLRKAKKGAKDVVSKK